MLSLEAYEYLQREVVMWSNDFQVCAVPKFSPHFSLEVTDKTSSDDLLKFIAQAGEKLGSNAAAGLRAVRKSVGDGANPVTVLYVRTGWENPVEWIINKWNRKSQYELAAQLVCEKLETPRINDSALKASPVNVVIRPAAKGRFYSTSINAQTDQTMSLLKLSMDIRNGKAFLGLSKERMRAARENLGTGIRELSGFSDQSKSLIFKFLRSGGGSGEGLDYVTCFSSFCDLASRLLEKDEMNLPKFDDECVKGALLFTRLWLAKRSGRLDWKLQCLNSLQAATLDYFAAALIEYCTSPAPHAPDNPCNSDARIQEVRASAMKTLKTSLLPQASL
jgi:hypothetical protein